MRVAAASALSPWRRARDVLVVAAELAEVALEVLVGRLRVGPGHRLRVVGALEGRLDLALVAADAEAEEATLAEEPAVELLLQHLAGGLVVLARGDGGDDLLVLLGVLLALDGTDDAADQAAERGADAGNDRADERRDP